MPKRIQTAMKTKLISRVVTATGHFARQIEYSGCIPKESPWHIVKSGGSRKTACGLVLSEHIPMPKIAGASILATSLFDTKDICKKCWRKRDG